MSQPIQTTDLETLELYLDGELDAAAIAGVDARLSADASLRTSFDRLRGQRARRLEAMSTAFDTDAASIERLVASVRDARAAEVASSTRSRWRINPTHFAAAACLACGLLLGGQLQRQSGDIGGQVQTPTVGVGAVGSAPVTFGGGTIHGVYRVGLYRTDGSIVELGRCHSLEQAQGVISNHKAASAAAHLTQPDLRVIDIGDQSY